MKGWGITVSDIKVDQTAQPTVGGRDPFVIGSNELHGDIQTSTRRTKNMTRTLKLTRSIIIVMMTGLLLVSGYLIANASPNAPVRMVPENFSSLADAVSPAIVHIRVEKTVKTSGPALGLG